MNRRIRHNIIPDDFVLGIHTDVVLVAKIALLVLLGPSSIRILLAALRIGPLLGRIAFFDLLIFFARVRLNWIRYKTGLLDLSFSG